LRVEFKESIPMTINKVPQMFNFQSIVTS